MLYIILHIFFPNLLYHNKPSRLTCKCKYNILSLWLIIFRIKFKKYRRVNEKKKPKRETHSFKDESKREEWKLVLLQWCQKCRVGRSNLLNSAIYQSLRFSASTSKIPYSCSLTTQLSVWSSPKPSSKLNYPEIALCSFKINVYIL